MKCIVNGCFDLFHEGHEKLFKFALKFVKMTSEDCYEKQLLVMLNTDESTRNLKGDGRPVNNFEKRADDILNYCKGQEPEVLVTIKSFNTEKELSDGIKSFNPEFIIRGNDITDVSKITGYPDTPILIKPRGQTKDGEDISTTDIINEQINKK